VSDLRSVPYIQRSTWVNADVRAMALALLSDADTIRDDEPHAEARRAHMLRASSHMLSAFAELVELQRFPPRM
jgi:hypothetical protein